jgi:hypothetical protein
MCPRWLVEAMIVVGARSKLLSWKQPNLADREFRRPLSSAHCMLERRSSHAVRSAAMPLSCIKDELLKQFDLRPCLSPGPS